MTTKYGRNSLLSNDQMYAGARVKNDADENDDPQYFTPGTNSLASGFKMLFRWNKDKSMWAIGQHVTRLSILSSVQ